MLLDILMASIIVPIAAVWGRLCLGPMGDCDCTALWLVRRRGRTGSGG